MFLPRKTLALAALAAALLIGPVAVAEGNGRDPIAVRRVEQDIARLRAELGKVNAEVSVLKRGGRSLRNDYRLRERMADAEALAQKLTAAEAQLRAQARASGAVAAGAPVVASPQASPRDGSVELEAKADLLLDQARKLDGEAGLLAKAADQMRSRKALRRKAGSWERDPFAGLETSRRNVVISAPTATTSTRGPTSESAPTTGSNGSTGGGAVYGPGSLAPPPVIAGPTMSDTAAKGATADGSAASKNSPLVSSAGADRQAVEQRLYLDPATAAELRHALGSGGGSLEPEALERGAATLRARARLLETQARVLRTQSRTP